MTRAADVIRFLVVAIVAGCAFNGSLLAAEGGKVEQLAKEGHWDADGWAAHSKLLGKPAPNLAMSDWRGTPVKAADMKGKIVVVDFWATWCGPCKAGVPHNNEVARKYAPKGVLVIGACGGEQEDKMNEVAQETKMEYPTAKTTPASTTAWGVQWWPHYVVVDRKGVIRAAGLKPDYVEKVVEALIEEQGAEAKPAK
jgi:thiol-disulfide isomerase/thioredoxin